MNRVRTCLSSIYPSVDTIFQTLWFLDGLVKSSYHVLSLCWPLRYLCKNDVRFVFIPICFVEGATSGAGTVSLSGVHVFILVFVWGSCYSIIGFLCSVL